MTDFLDLYLFERVIASGGFTAASRRTGLSKSRLSRRISALEERLGVRLLQRNSRHVAPTAVGDAVLSYVRRMIAEAERAEQAAREGAFEVSGELRISAPPLSDNDWLAQILSVFAQQHRGIEISMEMTSRFVDLIRERIDLALRLSSASLNDSDIIVRKLSVIPMRLVAAPALLAVEGEPRGPADLAGATWLIHGTPDGAEDWGIESLAGLHVSVTPRSRIVVNNDGMLRKFALDGRGIARLPHFLCEPDLRAGRLLHILPAWRTVPRVLYVAYPSRQGLSRAARSFIDFLVARLPPQIEEISKAG